MIEALGERGVAFSGESSHQVITAFAEERVANWAKEMLKKTPQEEDQTPPQVILQDIIKHTLDILEIENSTKRTELLLTPIEQGFKRLVAFSLSSETALRIEVVDPRNGLDPQNGKHIVAGNILRLAFLRVHPKEELIQRVKPSPNPIFRQIPQPKQDETYASVRGPHQKNLFGRTFGSDRSPKLIVEIQTVRRNMARQEKAPSPSSVDGVDGPLYTEDQLRILRERLGLSQVKLARALGVSRSLITEAEKGRRNGEKTRRRISEGLLRIYEQEGKPIPVFEVDQAE